MGQGNLYEKALQCKDWEYQSHVMVNILYIEHSRHIGHSRGFMHVTNLSPYISSVLTMTRPAQCMINIPEWRSYGLESNIRIPVTPSWLDMSCCPDLDDCNGPKWQSELSEPNGRRAKTCKVYRRENPRTWYFTLIWRIGFTISKIHFWLIPHMDALYHDIACLLRPSPDDHFHFASQRSPYLLTFSWRLSSCWRLKSSCCWTAILLSSIILWCSAFSLARSSRSLSSSLLFSLSCASHSPRWISVLHMCTFRWLECTGIRQSWQIFPLGTFLQAVYQYGSV